MQPLNAFTVWNVPGVLDGDVQPFIDRLVAADQAEKLRAESESAVAS